MAHYPDGPGALERALKSARDAGLKVVHYERHGRMWVFKVMRPKEAPRG